MKTFVAIVLLAVCSNHYVKGNIENSIIGTVTEGTDILSGSQENTKTGGDPHRGLSAEEFATMEKTVMSMKLLAASGTSKYLKKVGRGSLIGDIAADVETAEYLLEEAQANHGGSSTRKVTEYTFRRWPLTIPVVVDESAFTAAGYSENIQAGLKFWEDNTCIKFTQNGIPSNGDKYLYIQAGQSGCWSYVGKLSGSGQQLINLGSTCASSAAVVQHEVAHALGMYHEQSRPDRDDYVTVMGDNVIGGYLNNFNKQISSSTFNVKYDYASVMHYGPTAFSANGQPTLMPTNPDFLPTIGNRVRGSFFDIVVMNYAYGCKIDASDCPGLDCKNGGVPNPNSNCQSCICPEGLGGNECDEAAPSSSGCSPGSTLTASTTEQCVNSPNFPGQYSTGDKCNWIIKAPNANNRIQYRFVEDFGVDASSNTGTCYNWVEIKDNANMTLRGIRYCHTTRPTFVKTSETDAILVSFDASRDWASWRRKGFKLCYQLLPGTSGPCDTNPCQNEGVCEPNGDSYTCSCVNGYTGDHCETEPVDPCDPDPCENGGFCEDGLCTCVDGYTGDNCEIPPLCNPGPCVNNGICVVVNGAETCDCSATGGFTGSFCEIAPVDVCDSSPCLNNGVCFEDADGNAACVCTGGYTGDNCEVPPPTTSPCQPNPCYYGGSCMETGGDTYVCICAEHYTGQNCETHDPCLPDPCNGHGTCSSTTGVAVCECKDKWMGEFCDQRNPCFKNNGKPKCKKDNTDQCVVSSTGDEFECVCKEGFIGRLCHKPWTDPCVKPNGKPRCFPRGTDTCEEDSYLSGRFRCNCKEGYSGKLCNQDPINQCESSPCQNGGSCVDKKWRFKCRCVDGYRGPTCNRPPRN